MALGTVLMLAGGGLRAGGSLLEGQAGAKAAEFNEAVALRDAEFIEKSGELKAQNLRRMQAKELGQMRANFGASGVTLEGSPLDILAESAAFAALDLKTLQWNTAVKAQGKRIEAQFEQNRGESSLLSGNIGAASDLISTLGMVL
jgi:hypothetical protein